MKLAVTGVAEPPMSIWIDVVAASTSGLAGGVAETIASCQFSKGWAVSRTSVAGPAPSAGRLPANVTDDVAWAGDERSRGMLMFEAPELWTKAPVRVSTRLSSR